MGDSYTINQFDFICEIAKSDADTSDLIETFLKKFPDSHSRTSIRQKVYYIRSTYKRGKTPERPTSSENNHHKYFGVRQFTEEQLSVLSQDIPELDILSEFKQKYPTEKISTLQAFGMWIHCARYRYAINKEKKINAERMEELEKNKKYAISNSILIPKTINHVYDKQKKGDCIVEEGEILVKLLNSNIELVYVLSDVLKEIRNQTVISNKILSEFTKAKELNQKKLDMVTGLK
jgi:hypothetical protein